MQALWIYTVAAVVVLSAGTSEVTLSHPQASVEFKPFPWPITNTTDAARREDNSLVLAYHLRTRESSGRVSTVIGKNARGGDTLFELTLSIRRHAVVVILYGPAGEILGASKGLHIDVTNDIQHSIILKIQPTENAFTVQLSGAGKMNEQVDLTEPFPQFQKAFVTVYLGTQGAPPAESDTQSIYGCVLLLSAYTGIKQHAPVEERRQPAIWTHGEGGVEDECSDRCANVDCGGEDAPCINTYRKALCDCFGTGRAGQFCDKEATVLQYTDDEHVGYSLASAGDDQPHRIAVSFKTSNMDETRRLLLRAEVRSNLMEFQEPITAWVDKRHVRFDAIDRIIPSIEFPALDLDDGNWHTVTIKQWYYLKKIEFSVDSHHRVYTYNLTSKEDFLIMDKTVFFGGYPGLRGFVGCLKEAYVDYNSVNDLLVRNAATVFASSQPPMIGCTLGIPLLPPVQPLQGAVPTTPKPIERVLTKETEPVPPEPETEPLLPFTPMTTTEVVEEVKEKIVPTVPPLLQPCSDRVCQNGGHCVRHRDTGESRCECGFYTGNVCQFSEAPLSCAEAWELGVRLPGSRLIDVDGIDGPLEPQWVDCDAQGRTVVPNNFPNSSIVRERGYNDSVYHLDYRFMSTQHLIALKENSKECRQLFTYECNYAPLRLNTRTWFTTFGSQQEITSIGVPGSGGNCGNEACECDAWPKATVTDSDYILGTDAGVDTLTILQQRRQNWARLSIGPLECGGYKVAGAEHSGAVTFRSRQAYVSAARSWHVDQLQFWFKTSESHGLLATAQQQAGSVGVDAAPTRFELWMYDSHIIELYVGDDNDHFIRERVVSLKGVNNSQWHKVLFERNSKQIHLSLDSTHVYKDLSSEQDLFVASFDQQVTIGGRENSRTPGFIGCIKQLYIDRNVINIERKNFHGRVERRCRERCTNDSCWNGGDCSERFDQDGYSCECANRWAHSGDQCENDVNEGSEVSFRAKNAYIAYRDLKETPLLRPLLFSFRTDQQKALLMYADDERNNFVQVHLEDERTVKLTVNYNRSIRACTVRAPMGEEFSDMEWNQVYVHNADDYTAMHVNKLMCTINGTRLLATGHDQWIQGNEHESVRPPTMVVKPDRLKVFTLMHVGGLPRGEYGGSPYFYFSKIPNLLGCIRGVKVGETVIDLKNDGVRPSQPEAIVNNCETNCANTVCRHNGHCTVAWLDGMAASCDCSKTSYLGPNCNEDTGLHFTGDTAFVIEMDRVLASFVMAPKPDAEQIHFAFSTGPATVTRSLIRFRFSLYRSTLSLDLNDKGEVLAEMAMRGGERRLTNARFFGNHADGHRHFVVVRFHDGNLTLTVDQIQRRVRSNAKLLKLSAIIVGDNGQVPDGWASTSDANNNANGLPNATYYKGCVSNLVVDFGHGNKTRFLPFHYYRDRGSQYFEMAKTYPEATSLERASCASFVVASSGPIVGVNESFPDWTMPLRRSDYVASIPPIAEDAGDGSWWLWLLLVLLVIVVIMALIILCVCCCKRRGKSGSLELKESDSGRRQQPYYSEDEENDLHNPPPPAARYMPTLAAAAPNEEKEPLANGADDEPPLPPPPPTTPPPGLGALPTDVSLPEGNSNLDAPQSPRSLNNETPTSNIPPVVVTEAGATRPTSIGSLDSYVTAPSEFPPPPSAREIAEMPSPARTPSPPVSFRPPSERMSTFGTLERDGRTSPTYAPVLMAQSPSFRRSVKGGLGGSGRGARFVPPPTPPAPVGADRNTFII